MYRFFSWYNQNRRKVWIIAIAIIVIGLIIFRLLNIINDGLQSGNQNIANQTQKIDENSLNSIYITSERSAITGQESSISQDRVTVIDKFMEYCNSGNIEEAYKLLSDECKEEMYSTIDKFKTAYYIPVFGKGKKNVTITNWIGNIYKVDMGEDFLSTGKYTKENNLQDYITIVRNNENEYKLNVNKYIRSEELNKTANYENINLKVIKKDVYFDYEIYTIQIENKSEHDIKLGNVSSVDFSYLTDEKNMKYSAVSNELAAADMRCVSQSTKTVKIKYFIQYSSDRRIKSLVFPKFEIVYTGYDSINKYTEIVFNF